MNLCSVDEPCGTGHLDTVGYFREKNRFDCRGRVWVELKAWGRTTFDQNYADLKRSLPGQLKAHQRHDPSLCAVVLLAAKVDQVGRKWGTPQLFAELWQPDFNEWFSFGGTLTKKGRGQVRGVKRPLSAVFSFLVKGRSPPSTHHLLERGRGV